MARAIKKVKVKKQLTTKFYIIISTIIVAIIGGLIGLGLGLYVHFNTADLEKRFVEYTEYKINYDQLEAIKNGEYTDVYDDYQEIFIIVYNSSFYYDSEDEDLATDPTNLGYQLALSKLTEFKESIDSYNACDNKNYNIAFFMIDAGLTCNSAISTDTNGYGGFASPALIYIYGDTYTVEKDSYTLSRGGSVKEFNAVMDEATNYVRKSEINLNK